MGVLVPGFIVGREQFADRGRARFLEASDDVGHGTISGIVTLVQERRFRLVDDHGGSHLFLLAPRVALDARALGRLAASGERIGVAYREARGLTAHLATNLYRIA